MKPKHAKPVLGLVVLWILFLALAAGVGINAACTGSGEDSTSSTTSSPPPSSSGSVPSSSGSVTSTSEIPGKTFTLEELARYDGKDGRSAYVAVDGVVYDVSASARWPQGEHTPCNLGAAAGKDLSQLIKQAPANMRSLLEKMPVVGTLIP